jgi:cytochrome c-type biogenesis protein CcmE
MDSKKLAGALALLVGAGAVAFFALGNLEENIVYYWTPSDLLQKKGTVQGSTIRLGGMVQTGSLDWDADSLNLEFVMGEQPEPGGASVKVVSKGAPPQMFREGIGCIVEGRFDGQVFHSDRLMVKHSNEYRPPESHEDPRKLYETLITEPQPGALVPDRRGKPTVPAPPAGPTEEHL